MLATWSDDYVAGLTATRYRGSPNGANARDGLDRWVGLFSAAICRAVTDAEMYEARVSDLQDRWRARLGKVRAGSAAERLLDALPGAPMVTVRSAAALIDRTPQAVNNAFLMLGRRRCP